MLSLKPGPQSPRRDSCFPMSPTESPVLAALREVSALSSIIYGHEQGITHKWLLTAIITTLLMNDSSHCVAELEGCSPSSALSWLGDPE